jgi:hypothetical protein
VKPVPDKDGHHPRPAAAPGSRPELPDQEEPCLTNAALQEAYRKAFLLQIRRQQCPGCGETDLF